MASTVYYIRIGSGLRGAIAPVKYAWRTRNEAYKGMESSLGVVKAKEGESGLVFGANSPKPATVRINFEGGGSTVRFCDPSRLEGVTIGGRLNRKRVNIPGIFNNRRISTVTAIRG